MEYGLAEIFLEDGRALRYWSDFSLDSDFLTPADAWSFSFGSDAEWDRVKDVVLPDARVTVTLDGATQCTGWIDSVTASGESSTQITVNGRDILKPLVDSNVHPDTAIKSVTVTQLVEAVVDQIYNDNTPVIFSDNEANRKLLTGKSVSGKSKNASHQKLVEYCRPQANEGAFDFLSRNLRRFGLWLWGTADGNIVVSSPCYSQPASYVISRLRGDKTVQVKSASYTRDKTSVPSRVFVRGKAGGKEFAKGQCKGAYVETGLRLYKPMYVVHDNAQSDAECEAFARQEMSEKLRNSEVYECTLAGVSDPITGAVYAVDTIAKVQDEVLGVFQDMWVASRTFKRSSAGATTTTLKLLPKGAIQFSDVDAP